MDFRYSDVQTEFRASLRRYFAERGGQTAKAEPREMARRWRTELWEELAELGVLAALLPEAYGGMDGDSVDVIAMMEEAGRAQVGAPIIETAIVAAGLISRLGSVQQKQAFLPAIGAGKQKFAFADGGILASSGGDPVFQLTTLKNGKYRVQGSQAMVVEAPDCDQLIIACRGGQPGMTLFCVPRDREGVALRLFWTLDDRPVATVSLDRLDLDASDSIGAIGGAGDAVSAVVDLACVSQCAEAAGVMASLLNQTVEHLKTRTQFGQPLANFQALQHRLADMYAAYELSVSLIYKAAILGRTPGGSDHETAVSGAKVQTAEAARLIGHEAIQMHGAMGMSLELPVGRAVKRLKAMEPQYGSAAYHLRRRRGPSQSARGMSERRPIARHQTVGAMLAAAAAANPEKTALVFGERRRSFKALDEASSRIANALIANGHGHGHRAMIGIIGKNSDVFVEILFGAVKSGGVAVVLNWRLTTLELRVIVEGAGLAVLFYDVAFAGTVETLAAALPGVLWIPFDATDDPNPAFQAFVAGCGTVAPTTSVTPDDPAIMMYTSGTTGKPKGVPASHYAICFAPENMLAVGEHCVSLDSDINLLTTPLFHLAGIGWLHASIFAQATLIILPSADLPSIVAAIATHRVTRATVLPALMPALLDAVAQGIDLSSLRLIVYGASPIPESLLARMLANFSCGFLQNYGMTENSTSATALTPEDHYPGSPVLLSCGRPYPHVKLRTVDARGSVCRAGEIGEIELQSATLFTGYWRRPSATAEVWRDGWYATGDMGYLDENGYVFLVDRKKDMIISGGENIYPAEVESAIATHPEVVRAAVIGVPSEKWGEEVKAIVVLRDNSLLDGAALIAFLRPMIAGYKIPKSVDLVPELPLTAVGKIAKSALRERYWPANGRRIN